MPSLDDQLRVLTDGVADVLPSGGLGERLALAERKRRPLRVKLGIDPSSAHLTIGHAVVLRKLAQFQRFGHQVVLIIGSFTGMIGDPSGRSETRPRQTPAEVEAHARTYLAQVAKVLDVDAAEVRWNAEWLGAMSFADVAGLAAEVTVAQLLEREDFARRYAAREPISLVELLYPLMQATDSVVVRADVELGGTDQTFNLLVGRDLQQRRGQPGQVVMTVPLLEGIDGTRKMSKSLNNGVYLDEPPAEQFGKLMHVPDALVGKYLRLATDLAPAEVDELTRAVERAGPEAAATKRRMAREVVRLYHGPDAAMLAESAFDASRAAPVETVTADDLLVPAAAMKDGLVNIVDLLFEAGISKSRGEARRLVTQGAVRLDGSPVGSIQHTWPPADLDGRLLRAGRRSLLRLRLDPADGAHAGH